MYRAPYTRYTFVNLVVIPLSALSVMALLKMVSAKDAEEAGRMAKVFAGATATLVVAVCIKYSLCRQRIADYKRVLRVSRQAGVSDELIAMTQLWQEKH